MELQITKNIFDANKSYTNQSDIKNIPIVNQNSGTVYETDNLFGYNNFAIMCSKNGFDASKTNYKQLASTDLYSPSNSGSISEVNLMITRLKQVDNIDGKSNMCYIDGCFVFPTSACYPFLNSLENYFHSITMGSNYEDISGFYNAETSRNNFYQKDISLVDNSYVYLGYNSNNERITEKPFENSLMTSNVKLNKYLIGVKLKELGYTFLAKEYIDCFKTGMIEDYNFVVDCNTSGYLINSITPPYANGRSRDFAWHGNYNDYTSSINYMTYLQNDINNPLFFDNNFFTVYNAHNYDITSPINTSNTTVSPYGNISDTLGFGKINATNTTLNNSSFLKNGTNYKYIVTLNEVVYSYTRTANFDENSYVPYRTNAYIYSTLNGTTRSGWYIVKNVLSTSSAFYCNDMANLGIYNYSAGNLSSNSAQIAVTTKPLYTVGTNTGNGIHNDTYYNKAIITLERNDNGSWYAVARKTTDLNKTSSYNTATETFSNLADNSEYRWSIILYVKNDTLWNLENKGYITSVFINNLVGKYKNGIPYYFGTYDFKVETSVSAENSFLMNQLYIKAMKQCNGKITLNFGMNNNYCLAPTYNLMADINYSQDYSKMPTIKERNGSSTTIYSAYGGELFFNGVELNTIAKKNGQSNKFALNNYDNEQPAYIYFRMFGSNQSNLRRGFYQNIGCLEYYSSKDGGNTIDNSYELNIAVLVPTQSANSNYDVVLVCETINTKTPNDILDRQMYWCSSPHGTSDFTIDQLMIDLNLSDYHTSNNEKLYFKNFTSSKSGARLKFIYDEMYLNQTYDLENNYYRWNYITTYSIHFDDTILEDINDEFGYNGIVVVGYDESTEWRISYSVTGYNLSNVPPMQYFFYFDDNQDSAKVSAIPTIYKDIVAENGTVIENLCPTLTTLIKNSSDNIMAAKFSENQFLEIRNINELSENISFKITVAKSVDNTLDNDNVNVMSFIFEHYDHYNDMYGLVYIQFLLIKENGSLKMYIYGSTGGTSVETSHTTSSNYFNELSGTITEQGNSGTISKLYEMNIDFTDCIPWAYLRNDDNNTVKLKYALIHKSINSNGYNKNTDLYCTNLKMYKDTALVLNYTPSTNDVANVDNISNFKPFTTPILLDNENTVALCLLRKESNDMNDLISSPNSFGAIGYKEFIPNEYGEYEYTLEDCFNKSNILYRYGICEYNLTNGAQKENAIYSDVVKNSCSKFLIADKLQSFEFLANVIWGSIEHSSNVTYVATLNNKYPYVVDVANDDFVTGNVSLDIVNDEFLDGSGYLDAHMIQEKVDNFCKFLKSKTTKVIKDWNGRSYLIYIIPSTIENVAIANNLTKISFNFVEVGDLNNEQDLEENEVYIGDDLQEIIDKYTN